MKNKPKFYALRKNINTGKIEKIDVLERVFYDILTEKGAIKKSKFVLYDWFHKSKAIVSKDELKKFLEGELRYYFWSKCEQEFVAVDWPYKDDSIKDSHPEKIDVFDQVEPNLDVITGLVWDYIEPKIKSKA